MTGLSHIHRNLVVGAIVVGFTILGPAIADEPGDIVYDDVPFTDTTTTDVAITHANTTVGLNQNVVDKISNDYRPFLGDNAEAVVTGLRTGNEITLTTTTPEGTTTTSFTPPTGKMGYGNVSHSLGLAQEQLKQYGITEPTAEELQAALIGGDITAGSGGTETLDGVLTLRSEGMGWGEIAQEYGVKLGHVVSATKSGKEHPLASTYDQTATTTQGTSDGINASKNPGKVYGKGIVTGAGSDASGYANNDKVKTSQGKSHAYGRGIVTASGASVGGGNAPKGIIKASTGKAGHAYGQGVVTASGASASSHGITSGGKGNGLAKGRSK